MVSVSCQSPSMISHHYLTTGFCVVALLGITLGVHGQNTTKSSKPKSAGADASNANDPSAGGKPAKNDPRVLLLKMDDEQSAGLNLTNLNHAVFVHPLLAGSQQEYDSYETQAVGRIRRFGQRKVVHVWRFLAEDTIDTEIYAQRRTVTPSEVVE